MIKIIAWNDPVDITDCNNWGFETHTIGEVNSITEAIEKAKKDLKEYAEDWYDGEEDQEEKVKEYTSLMNFWYEEPHWDYDRKNLCFIEISDSKEHDDHSDIVEEPRPGSVIQIID